MEDTTIRGILYGIGVGPGEPELMTVKALKCLEKSDVIILPTEPKEECYAYNTARAVYPDIDSKEIICMPFPMTKEKQELREIHNSIYGEIAALLAQGKTTAFLTIGDPSVYSTYNYIHKREKENGGAPVMVSGVPSFCAAAAALGISLGDNKQQIHVIPGSYQIEDTLHLKGTKIYMKSGKNLEKLKELLLNYPDIPEDKVYSISNCGLPDEKKTSGIRNIDLNGGYLTIVIVKDK